MSAVNQLCATMLKRVRLVAALYVVALCSQPTAAADTDVLMDMTQLATLDDWTVLPRDAFVQNTVAVDDGNTVNTFVTCQSGRANVSSWLISPFIQRQGALALHVELNFTMRDCSAYTGSASLQCRETFFLRYLEADQPVTNLSNTDQFTFLKTVAATVKWKERVPSANMSRIINSVTETVAVSKSGIYIAIQDLGTCTSLLSMRVYYKSCPLVRQYLYELPKTPTGIDPNQLTRVQPGCIANSAIVSPADVICKLDGNWDSLPGAAVCQCVAGFQLAASGACEACAAQFFKPTVGGTACQACPANSDASLSRTECPCRGGFYRTAHENSSFACTEPPSAPQDLKATNIGPDFVHLSWLPPATSGGRSDVVYRVSCLSGCPGDRLKFNPANAGLQQTSVRISGFSPSQQIELAVIAENGVSQFATANLANATTAVVRLRTATAEPQKVTNLQAAVIGADFVILKWDASTFWHDNSLTYQVNSYPKNDFLNNSLTTVLNANATIRQLAPGAEYMFQVRAGTAQGWGPYSDLLSVRTVVPTAADSAAVDTRTVIIVACVICLGICVCLGVTAALIVLKRQKAPGKSCADSVATASACNFSPTMTTYYHSQVSPNRLPLVPGGRVLSRQGKSYVDPHNYEDPQLAVREFTKEISPECITIEDVIGFGEFGEVCKGKLRLPHRPEMAVAIKTLKEGVTDKNRVDFLTEASNMGQFDHQNVIYLQGVVTKSQPVMIVTEYMENGSLDVFLRKNDGQLTIIQLVGMLRGIASGMHYLSEMGYVHRDLAARNILVDHQLVCKVADFGLSRFVEAFKLGDPAESAYTTKGGKIPVRWTAPEAIAFRKFTTLSDVWSYGIVMWEVISYGQHPYWDWSNQTVIQMVENGYRLPPPMDCPCSLYQLMLQCWQRERQNRPRFGELVREFDKLIRHPEKLSAIEPPRLPAMLPHSGLNPFASIDDWLQALNLSHYAANFLQNGYTSLWQVSQMTADDLARIGVEMFGHRKRLYKQISALKDQLSLSGDAPPLGHLLPALPLGHLAPALTAPGATAAAALLSANCNPAALFPPSCVLPVLTLPNTCATVFGPEHQAFLV